MDEKSNEEEEKVEEDRNIRISFGFILPGHEHIPRFSAAAIHDGNGGSMNF